QEEARGHGVDPDARTVLLRHVHCQPLGEVGYRCLGRAIGGYTSQGAQGIHGGYVDDTALASRGHAASEHLTTLERAGKIQAEDAIDRLHIQVKEGLIVRGGSLRLVASRGVDQNIYWAEGARDL